jgi:hypothetical protein
MTGLFEFPTSRIAAKEQGRTYFYANRECPVHHTRFHWAHSGECMGCYDFHGEKLPAPKQQAKPNYPKPQVEKRA